MNLEGVNVNHKKFGDGKILNNTDKVLIVRFTEGDKRFLYPESFETHLSILDVDIERKFKSEIDELRKRANVKAVLKSDSSNKNYLLSVCDEQKQKVRELVERRNINSLIHFTRQENLLSILQHGLVPVNLQQEMKIESIHNDDQRIDEQLDATSLSIEFPNYSLFYQFRKYKYPDSKWIVLDVDKEVLFCPSRVIFYCRTNAASVLPRTSNTMDLCKADSFENLFCESALTKDNKLNYRSALQIGNNIPTDPQAEILISGIIESQYINKIYFQNKNSFNEWRLFQGSEKLSEINYQIKPELFGPRNDYSFWQKEK